MATSKPQKNMNSSNCIWATPEHTVNFTSDQMSDQQQFKEGNQIYQIPGFIWEKEYSTQKKKNAINQMDTTYNITTLLLHTFKHKQKFHEPLFTVKIKSTNS
jgi:hypothetical protein